MFNFTRKRTKKVISHPISNCFSTVLLLTDKLSSYLYRTANRQSKQKIQLFPLDLVNIITLYRKYIVSFDEYPKELIDVRYLKDCDMIYYGAQPYSCAKLRCSKPVKNGHGFLIKIVHFKNAFFDIRIGVQNESNDYCYSFRNDSMNQQIGKLLFHKNEQLTAVYKSTEYNLKKEDIISINVTQNRIIMLYNNKIIKNRFNVLDNFNQKYYFYMNLYGYKMTLLIKDS